MFYRLFMHKEAATLARQISWYTFWFLNCNYNGLNSVIREVIVFHFNEFENNQRAENRFQFNLLYLHGLYLQL
jgi:hypothetical protein